MRFLNPRTDFAFNRVFGAQSSPNILVSSLNAILAPPTRIASATVIDPAKAPKVVGRKGNYLDVLATNAAGQQTVMVVQMMNVPCEEGRALYEACQSPASEAVQISVRENYPSLTKVIALTITDFTMFPARTDMLSRYQLRANDGELYNGDLELVFVELPKFTKQAHELLDLRDKWLYFLQNADDLRVVPDTLQQEPPIAHAFEIANQAGLTQEEELAQRQRVDWIGHVREQEERVALNKRMEAENAAVKKSLAALNAALADREKALAVREKAFADAQAKGSLKSKNKSPSPVTASEG